MKKPYKITIIGCGTMGTVLIERLLTTGLVLKKNLVGCDKSAAVLKKIKKQYGIIIEKNLSKAVNQAEIIFLAVKPQHFKDVSSQLAFNLKDAQLVISIMAGISSRSLSRSLKHKKIVRTMPNLAARVGRGVTLWYAEAEVAGKTIKVIDQILSSLGMVIRMKKEEMIDKATAISGSGPAYFYYTAEQMEKAAKDFGFSEKEAALLVRETLIGAAELEKLDSRTNAKLRQAVTSKGGTTEAALKKLGPRFEKLMSKAIKAAYQQAKIISKRND